MHEQNFEKGVRQGLEGFTLPPSPPVWAGVEAQIRRKRERRRILFWFLPLAMLVFLATWLLLTETKTGVSKTAPQNQTNTSARGGDKGESVNTETAINKATPAHSQVQLTDGKEVLNNQPEIRQVKKMAANNKKKGATRKRSSAGSENEALALKSFEQTKVIKETMSKSSEPLDKSASTAVLPNALAVQPESLSSSNLSSSVISIDDTNSVVQQTALLRDSLAAIKDSASLAPKPKKGQRSRLELGVVFNFGSSGITTGLFDGLEEKALSDFSPGTIQNNSGGVPPLPPSDIRRGRYFALGFSANYNIHKRLSVSAGLQYQRLTTQLTVGSPGDSSNLTFRSAPTYFNNDSRRRTYTNAYHFASLPVALRYQLHKKAPIFLSGGLLFSRLLSTNALHYSSANNIYYRDSSLIKKNSAGFVTGLSYSLRLGKSLSLEAGPQFQYHLTPASKVVGIKPQHLYSIGLGASIKFK